MTLQWSAVALALYVEIGITILLMLPWIRPSLWNKLFKSRILTAIERHANVYSIAGVAVLLLLFFDAIREVRKYAYVDMSLEGTLHTANADAVTHMRLFRAQRNLYISGFALFLFLIIKRLVALIARSAQLEAAAEAAMKQAQGASKAAKTLMESTDGGNDDKVKELKRQIEELGKELKSAQKDRDAMKTQAENLQEEYNRLASEFNKKESSHGDKKSK